MTIRAAAEKPDRGILLASSLASLATFFFGDHHVETGQTCAGSDALKR